MRPTPTFLHPTALVDWLPPAEMTGEIHEFDARVGGGYRMSLFYPPDEHTFRGKTSSPTMRTSRAISEENSTRVQWLTANSSAGNVSLERAPNLVKRWGCPRGSATTA